MMFDIIIPSETVRLSKSPFSSQIFSQIYCQIDFDTFFPEKSWDDFTLTIMNWWVVEAQKVIYLKTAEFLFMDGPFYFETSPHSEDRNNLEIKFYERTLHGKKLIFSIDKIPKSNLIQEIIKGANTLLRSLQKINHLDLEEYDKLENNLKSLRALYNKNKPQPV